jgi:ribosomal protein S18 acetylase RimI-like enzyme
VPADSRPALAGDRPFLLDLYIATRAAEFSALGWSPEALRAFLEQQYRAREAGWGVSAPDGDDRILVRDGRPIGRLVIDRRPDGIRVVDVAVVPAEQGRGIGSAVLRQVLEEADAARVPVTLHVVTTNPALRLYERLGFVPVSEDGIHVLMERASPESAVAQPNTAT